MENNQPIPPNQPQTVSQSDEVELEKKSVSKALLYLLGLLIVGLTVTSAYLFFQNQSLKSQLGLSTLELPSSTQTCAYNGQVYKPGEGFAASDGCNSCSCSETGEVACTDMACEINEQSDSIDDWEVYNNPIYSLELIDGCNSCSYTDGGEVACTETMCEKKNARQIDPTGWETYNNPVYSIKYPKDFEIRDYEDGSIGLFKLGPSQGDGQELHDGAILTLNIREFLDNQSLVSRANNVIKERNEDTPATVVKEPSATNLGDYSVVTFVTSASYITAVSETILVQSPDNAIVVVMDKSTPDPDKRGYSREVNQILSTFKFID